MEKQTSITPEATPSASPVIIPETPKSNNRYKKTTIYIILSLIALSGAIYTGVFLGNRKSLKLPFLTKPCEYAGNIYKQGEGFPAEDGCNQCSCSEGLIMCTEKGCITPTKTIIKPSCGKCPQLMSLAPDFCKNGVIEPGKINECGCQLGPVCLTPTPTTKKTIDLQTYVDSNNNFSFMYPSSLTPKPNEDFPRDVYSSFTLFEGETNSFSLYVSLQNNMSNEIATIRSQNEGHVISRLIKNETIKIDNRNGWVLEYTSEEPNEPTALRIITSNGKNVIVLNLNSNISNQIVSTFKFIR